MLSLEKLTRIGVFMATGYICAGTAIAIIGGIPLWTEYFESSFWLIATVIIATVLIAGAIGICLMRYLIKKVGPKAVFEQDLLIYMIGMLFMALTINKAMFMVGIIIVSATMPVYFYENFNRQMLAVKKGGNDVLYLAGWLISPVLCVLLLSIFSSYGLVVPRIIFAHFIIIAFWAWIKRLDIHESYSDAPDWLLDKESLHKQDLSQNDFAPTTSDNTINSNNSEDGKKQTED